MDSALGQVSTLSVLNFHLKADRMCEIHKIKKYNLQLTAILRYSL